MKLIPLVLIGLLSGVDIRSADLTRTECPASVESCKHSPNGQYAVWVGAGSLHFINKEKSVPFSLAPLAGYEDLLWSADSQLLAVLATPHRAQIMCTRSRPAQCSGVITIGIIDTKNAILKGRCETGWSWTLSTPDPNHPLKRNPYLEWNDKNQLLLVTSNKLYPNFELPKSCTDLGIRLSDPKT